MLSNQKHNERKMPITLHSSKIEELKKQEPKMYRVLYVLLLTLEL